MDRKQAMRMATLLERWINLLNTGLTHARYSLSTNHKKPYIAFSIAEKLPIGDRYLDASGNPANWKVREGPSHQMCEVIAMTSATDDEVIERWRSWTFDRVDTTRSAMQGASAADIEQMIATRVSVILKEQLEKLISGQLSIQQAAAQPLEQRTPAPVPTGIQERPKVDMQAAKQRTLENNTLWAERAKLIGMDPPEKAAAGNGIARKWLKEAEKRWAAHQKQVLADSGTAVIEEPVSGLATPAAG
jgi:hypothetical protein